MIISISKPKMIVLIVNKSHIDRRATKLVIEGIPYLKNCLVIDDDIIIKKGGVYI